MSDVKTSVILQFTTIKTRVFRWTPQFLQLSPFWTYNERARCGVYVM